MIGHITVTSLGVPTHLHATHLVSSHALHALGAPDVSRGIPYGLGQVVIPLPSPEFLVFNEALRDQVAGVLSRKSTSTLVLPEVLPLFGEFVVLDSSGGARVELLVSIETWESALSAGLYLRCL